MALLQLIARLGLDTAGFSSGLRRAEGEAKTSSQRMSMTFGSAFRGGLGIGLGLGLIRQITSMGKSIQSLERDYKEMGITIDKELVVKMTEFGNVTRRVAADVKLALLPIGSLFAGIIEMAIDVGHFVGAVAVKGRPGGIAALHDIAGKYRGRRDLIAKSKMPAADEDFTKRVDDLFGDKATRDRSMPDDPIKRARDLWIQREALVSGLSRDLKNPPPGFTKQLQITAAENLMGIVEAMRRGGVHSDPDSDREVVRVLKQIEENTKQGTVGFN